MQEVAMQQLWNISLLNVTYKIFTNILVKLKHTRIWNNPSAMNSPASVQTDQNRSDIYSSYAL